MVERNPSSTARGMSGASRRAADGPVRKGAGAALDGSRPRDREVVETAVRIFWEKGYAGASIRDVADALGMLKGSLYYYIESKESLLVRILQESQDELAELARSTSTSEGSAAERLAAYLRAYAMWTLTHVERAGLLAREWRHAPEPVRASLAEPARQHERVLRDLMTGCQAEGAIAEGVDLRRASTFISSAFASMPDWYRPGRTKPEAVADEYVALALRAVGIPAT